MHVEALMKVVYPSEVTPYPKEQKKKKMTFKGSKTRYPCILAVIEIIQFRMNANYIKIEKKLVLKQENGCLKSLSYN